MVTAIVRTDEGVSGLGYTLAFAGGGAEAIQAYLDTRLIPLVVGEDPLLDRAALAAHVPRRPRHQTPGRRRLRAVRDRHRPVGPRGQGRRAPTLQALGRVTDRVAAYGSGGWGQLPREDVIDEARRYVRLGCRYYKMKIHDPDPRVNRQRVEAVRKALGDGVRIMVDVNQKLDVLGNIRQAQPLEDLDLVWYEEPVLADDIASCAEVARVDPHPGRHRREQLHALRVPRPHRAARRPLPDARRVPRQRLQRDAPHRAASPRRTRSRLAARRPRAVAARRRRDRERLPRRVHGVGAAGPVRRVPRVEDGTSASPTVLATAWSWRRARSRSIAAPDLAITAPWRAPPRSAFRCESAARWEPRRSPSRRGRGQRCTDGTHAVVRAADGVVADALAARGDRAGLAPPAGVEEPGLRVAITVRPRPHRRLHHAAHGLAQPSRLVPRERARSAPRIDARLVQDLVGDPVPHPGRERLVEQHRLYRGRALGEARRELRGRGQVVEGVEAEEADGRLGARISRRRIRPSRRPSAMASAPPSSNVSTSLANRAASPSVRRPRSRPGARRAHRGWEPPAIPKWKHGHGRRSSSSQRCLP